MMWYWGGGGLQWWGWLLMSLGMVFCWGLVIWTIWYFATSVTRGSQLHQRPPDARRILDERLARGEIDTEEYRRLRELMGGGEVRSEGRQKPVGT